MHIILLGIPGVGKGTQANKIMANYQIPQISTGDILRLEIKNETPLGKKVKSIMERGELVSDDLILQIAENRLSQPDCSKGFILDGFPRTVPQADGLGKILHKMGNVSLKVIEIAVPDEEIIKRLASRRVCDNCGAVYSLLINPPQKEGVCDACGGPVTQRDDDKEETIKNRLVIYRQSTTPLIRYYQERGHFYQINGLKPVNDVFKDILKLLE